MLHTYVCITVLPSITYVIITLHSYVHICLQLHAYLHHKMSTNYCRLCAQLKSDLTSIIDDENLNNLSLNYKITKFFQIKIEENDDLPKYICSACCENVFFVYDFYEKIHKAQMYLKNVFRKQKNDNIKIEVIELNSDLTNCPAKTYPIEIENESNENVNENLCINLENSVSNHSTSKNIHTEIKIEPESVVAHFEQILIKNTNEQTATDVCNELDISKHLQFERIHTGEESFKSDETYQTEERMSSSDIDDVEEVVSSVDLIPKKSSERYRLAYDKYEKWCKEKNIEDMTDEKFLLVYFNELSKIQKPSSLWCYYSMLRTELSVKKNFNIKVYTSLTTLLKNKSQGYRPKKTKVFSRENVARFLKNADNERFLWIKVVLIFGVAGACRREELTYMLKENVKDEGFYFRVLIPNSRTKMYREFFITSGNIDGVNLVEIVRQYLKLRPECCDSKRFFLTYRNGKCTKQPIGINTIGNVPKLIAQFLNLPHPNEYTGHCFRRSSTILLGDCGISLLAIKRHIGRSIPIPNTSSNINK